MAKNSFQNDAFQYDENDNIKNYDLKSIEFDKSVHQKNDHSLKDELIKEDLTPKDKLLILSLGLTIFTCFAGSSVVSPFLPRVAESKGLSITKYSYIFAVYEFIGFLLPPLACKLAIRMTPKVFLITSMFVFSCCSTIFGFLIYAKGGNTFFILAIIVRIFWSCAGASAKTSIYMSCTILFPSQYIALVFSVIEIGAGSGFMIGPALGGYLYELGGFPLPFIMNSILCLLSIIPCYLLIKNDVKPKKKDEKETSIFDLLKVPGVSLNLFISTITCLCFGYNNSTMDFNLRSISPSISTTKVGQVMLVSGFIYSVFTYIFGYIADKYKKSYYLIFPGLVFLIFCYIFIGPLYGLPIEPSISNVVISQCCFGFGMASVIIMSFDDGAKEARIFARKYSSSTDSTMAGYSSLVTCSYALGAATGPFLASITVEKFGFRISTIFCLASLIILTAMTIIYVIKIKKESVKDNIKTIS